MIEYMQSESDKEITQFWIDRYLRLEMENSLLVNDAARYRWLRERLMAADFDWQERGECALVFVWPKDCAVSGNCDATIDAAMLKTPNVK